MELSIIICVYNTPEHYLDECLHSITESTLGASGREYEICIVDDGSEIDYTALLERYSPLVKYKKIPNGGMFRARDEGIALAEGEYIAFVDSDDTVSFNYHLPMLRAARESGADIVVNDWAFHTEHSRYYLTGDMTVSRNLNLRGGEALLAFTSQRGRHQALTVLWNKLYSGNLIRRVAAEASALLGDMRGFNYSEDALRNLYLFAAADLVVNLHTGYYFYRQHSAQSVNVVGREVLCGQIERMAFTLSEMERICAARQDSEELLRNVRAWRELMSRTHYSYAKRAGYTDLYPLIAESYRVTRLRTATVRDGSVYGSVAPIADNIVEVDAALLRTVREGECTVCYSRRDRYTSRCVKQLISAGYPITPSPREGRILPRERVSLKNRVLHNPLVYRLAMLLFPKGSRLRALLKRRA